MRIYRHIPEMQFVQDAMRAYLEKNNLLEKDLAEQMGVNRSTISRWINGVVVPNKFALRALGKLIGLDLERKV